MQTNTAVVAIPKVSIIIPVYNGENFLREAIDSALAQTYPDIEILVVNDGSRDEGATERIALSYGNSIRYFSKENGGVASALNRGIAEMAGDYFSWLSHDDLYTRDKIEKEMTALTKIGRDDAIIYSDYAFFTTDPENATNCYLKNVPPEHFRYWLTIENSLHGCSLLIPRAAFDMVGSFNESLRTTQDMDLWFRMAKNYTFIHVPLVLVKSRCHDAQGSHVMTSISRAECNNLFSKFINELDSQEILHATGVPLAESYAKIASSLFNRGFNEAGALAEKYASKNSSRRATVIRNIGYLKNRFINMCWKRLPFQFKQVIKTSVLRRQPPEGSWR